MVRFRDTQNLMRLYRRQYAFERAYVLDESRRRTIHATVPKEHIASVVSSGRLHVFLNDQAYIDTVDKIMLGET